MELHKGVLAMLCLAVLVLGAIGGYVMAPEPTHSVEVRTVEVPGPERVELVEVEVVKEVQVSNTSELARLRLENAAWESSYDVLLERYEQVSNERFDPVEFDLELEYLERAKDLVENEYKYLFLLGDYTLSEVSIDRYYDEDADVRTVTRYVDGKRIDYELPRVSLEARVVYDSDDDKQVEYFDIEVEWDLDRDGDEEETVSVELQE
jgi:hypothetical protein